VTKAWTESGATWTRNASSYDPKVVAKQAIAPALVGKFVSFDVTSLAQTWVSSPSKNLGCLLRGVEGNSATEVVFNSRRQFTPSRRPRLELTYSR
jgi:hypothetical protein